MQGTRPELTVVFPYGLEAVMTGTRIKSEFDLFISYASKDQVIFLQNRKVSAVRELKAKLEQHVHPQSDSHFRVCTDHEDFELDDTIREAIRNKIEASTSLLVVCSQSARNSKYVRFELQCFAELHRPRGRRRKGQRPIAAYLDRLPSEAFPEVFDRNSLSANLSVKPEMTRKEWRRQLQDEGHKIVARVWGLPLQNVHDRFAQERLAARRRVIAWASLAGIVLLLAVGWGIKKAADSFASQRLAEARRYASDMAEVQAAWTENRLSVGQARLETYLPAPGKRDLRGFEWYSYWRVFHNNVFTVEDKKHNPVRTIAAATSAAMAAYSSDEAPVRLLDAETGRKLAMLPDSTRASEAIAFSNDGRTLLSAAGRDLVSFSTESQRSQVITTGHQAPITSVAFSPDGSAVASADKEGSVIIWDGVAKQERTTIRTGNRGTTKVLFTADGKLLACVGKDGVATAFDTSTFKPLGAPKALGEQADWSHAQYAVRGETLLVPLGEGLVLWNCRNGRQSQTLKLHSFSVLAVALSPNGQTLATAGADGDVRLWRVPDENSVTSWEELGTFKGHSGQGYIVALAFAANGQVLISGTLGGKVKGWNVRRVGRNVLSHLSEVRAVTIGPNDRTLMAIDDDSNLKQWNLQTRQEVWTRKLDIDVRWISSSPDGQIIVGAGSQRGVKVWATESGKELHALPGYGPVAFAPMGNTIVWVHEDTRRVKLRNLDIGREVELSGQHGQPISALAFSPDGTMLAAAGEEGQIDLWNVVSERVTLTLAAHGKLIDALGFSPDGRLLASGSMDGTVKLWDPNTGTNRAELSGHAGAGDDPGTVYSVAFSPDGKTLASGSRDGRVKLWNVAAGQEMVTFHAHRRQLGNGVNAVCFSRTGSELITAGSGGTIIVWEAASNSEVKTDLAKR